MADKGVRQGPRAKLAYTVQEAIALLPWGQTKVYELIKSGVLPTRFQFGRRYVLHEDLVAILTKVAPSARSGGKLDADRL